MSICEYLGKYGDYDICSFCLEVVGFGLEGSRTTSGLTTIFVSANEPFIEF